MKTLILSILMLISYNVFSQWVQQPTGTTSHLYNIQLVNRYTGWATGSNNTILKTTNGGNNWVQQYVALPGSRILLGISIINESTGYIVGDWRAILKTTDGGTNWIVLRVANQPIGDSYMSCYFINVNTGWISGFSGSIYRTSNGGLSWDSIPPLFGAGGFTDLQFIDINTGFLCGGLFYRTTNSGYNWQASSQFTNSNTPGLSFINANTGWVITEQSATVFKTTNGGYNWIQQFQLPTTNSYCIFFSSLNTGWAGGAFGKVYRSSNSGVNWLEENANPLGFVSNFYFYNDSIGWASCGNGKIIHTSNGGEPVGIANNTNNTPDGFKLYQNYPNPFNSTTRISFDIPVRSLVEIKVYNVLGEEISTIINSELEQGSYTQDFKTNGLSSGVYFYRITAQSTTSKNMFYRETKKMIYNK